MPSSYAWNGWTFSAVLISLLVSLPILTIIFNLFQPSGATWQHILDTVLKNYIFNTVLLMLAIGTITSICGLSMAWIITNFNFPGSKLADWLLILPLSIPTYIMAYTYAGIFDYSGFFAFAVRNVFGIMYYGFDIMNIYGVVMIMSLVLYPYVYVITKSSFQLQSKNILEVSRLLGCTSWNAFFKVAIPVSRPALVGGLSLVLMEVLNDYGAVKYFGVPTFTTGIFRAWFSLGDSQSAINLSAILVVFVLFLLVFERIQRGQAQYDMGAATHRPLMKQTLRGWQGWACTLFCFIPILLGFILPVLQLIYWAWQTGHSLITHDYWIMVFNSFGLAFGAALLCVITGTLLIYSVRLNYNYFMRGLSKLATMGYSIPGAVIAVGIMIPLITTDRLLGNAFAYLFEWNTGLILSGTVFILILAYLVRFLTVGYNAIDAGFKKVGFKLTEVSRLLGASPMRTLFTINLPLVKSALFSAGLLVFVDVVKELPITLILRPFNFHTLATRAFELASDELVAQSAGASLMIIATGILPVILLNKLSTRGQAFHGVVED